LKDLKDALVDDELSTPEKLEQLKSELAEHHQDNNFLKCRSMAEVLMVHMKKFIFTRERWAQ